MIHHEDVLTNFVRAALDVQGSALFKNSYWFDSHGKSCDILENGRLSCAIIISRLLLWFRPYGSPLCLMPHGTVEGLLKDLETCGWYDIALKERRSGSIVVWEKVRGNIHVGIGINDMSVLSNCRSRRIPVLHPWTMETDLKTPRKIERILWHDAFNE